MNRGFLLSLALCIPALAAPPPETPMWEMPLTVTHVRVIEARGAKTNYLGPDKEPVARYCKADDMRHLLVCEIRSQAPATVYEIRAYDAAGRQVRFSRGEADVVICDREHGRGDHKATYPWACRYSKERGR